MRAVYILFFLSFFFCCTAQAKVPAMGEAYLELKKEIQSLGVDVDSPTAVFTEKALELSKRARQQEWHELVYLADSFAAEGMDRARRFTDAAALSEQYINAEVAVPGTEPYLRFLMVKISKHAFEGIVDPIYPIIETMTHAMQHGEFDPYFRAKMMVSMGNAYIAVKQFDNGIKWLKKSLSTFEEINQEHVKQHGLLFATRFIGNAYYMMGDLENAKRYYTEGLSHAEVRQNIPATQAFYYNLTLVYGDLGEWERALTFAMQSATLAKKHGDQATYGASLAFASRSLVNLERYDEAIDNQLLAISELEKPGGSDYLFYALAFLAEIYIKSGKPELAKAALLRAKSQEHHALGADRSVDYAQVEYLVWQGVGDYHAAFHALKKYTDLMQEDFKAHQATESQKLMVEYEVELSKAREQALLSDNALKAKTLEQKEQEMFSQKLIIVLGFLLLLVVAAVLIRERYIRHKMHKLAMTDPLTGAPNRRAIEKRALQLLSNERARKSQLGVALLDIDHFKRINDTYGHDVGDEVLVNFTKACQRCLRDGDYFGRFGGEEFLMLLPGATSTDIQAVFARIQSALKQCPTYVNDVEIPLTVSMGAALSLQDGQDRQDLKPIFLSLIKSADDGVYQAKSSGRDQMVLCA